MRSELDARCTLHGRTSHILGHHRPPHVLLVADVAFGSWLCENAKTLNRDRRSYSSKTALVAQGASGLNLEVGLENIILRCVSIFEFLHGQGQTRTSGWSAPLEPDRLKLVI